MSTQNESMTLAQEIIDNASVLPLECQDWLLAIAKGMAFTTKCLTGDIRDVNELRA